MFIFAAITTIKQSNLHPCQVISKLPSTSTVQAASENKQKFPLFTEKRGDYMKLFRHMYILTMCILQYRMGMFSLGLSVVGAVKKNTERRGGKRQPGGKAFTVCWLLRKKEDAVWQSVCSPVQIQAEWSWIQVWHFSQNLFSPSFTRVCYVCPVKTCQPECPVSPISVCTPQLLQCSCVLLQTWPLESASSV